MADLRGKMYTHVCVCIHIYAFARFHQYNEIVLYKVRPIFNITYLLLKMANIHIIRTKRLQK